MSLILLCLQNMGPRDRLLTECLWLSDRAALALLPFKLEGNLYGPIRTRVCCESSFSDYAMVSNESGRVGLQVENSVVLPLDDFTAILHRVVLNALHVRMVPESDILGGPVFFSEADL